MSLKGRLLFEQREGLAQMSVTELLGYSRELREMAQAGTVPYDMRSTANQVLLETQKQINRLAGEDKTPLEKKLEWAEDNRITDEIKKLYPLVEKERELRGK